MWIVTPSVPRNDGRSKASPPAWAVAISLRPGSHCAGTIMKLKRKLLVVAGSGASIDFGMPSVSDIDRFFRLTALQNFPLTSDPQRSLYDHVYRVIRDFWRECDPGAQRLSKPNFEDILYALYALAGVRPHGVMTGGLAALVDAKPLPDVTWFGRDFVSGMPVLDEFIEHLATNLVAKFRKICARSDANRTPEIEELHGFFAALKDEFDIAVVSVNYDNIIFRTLPDLHTGFDIGGTNLFGQERILNTSSWTKILHLHGSVHFDRIATGCNFGEIVWRDNLAGSFSTAQFGLPYNREAVSYPSATIIAGHGKAAQLLGPPFRTYYSALDWMVLESDALLVLGYGFGDHHLNQPLNQYRDSRNRPIVLIDKACDNTLTAGSDRNQAHPAVVRALDWFDTPAYSMSWLGYSFPDSVARLKAEKEFELSTYPTRPLAIWYGGMLDACRNADKIVRELRASPVIS